MIKNILQGIKAYLGAFSLISKLKLWRYFVIPMLISLVTAVILCTAAYSLSSYIGNYISKIWIWDFGKEIFISISNILGTLIIIVVGIILFKHIIMALSTPFMSPVSEKIEHHITGIKNYEHRKTNFAQQLWRGVKINGRNLGMELLITLPLLLLKFIPLINILSTILLFLVQAYYAGFGNIDYTLERHFNYKNSIKFVKANKGLAIGNGIVFILFLLIPVVGVILVLPLSVTAATTRTIEALKLTKHHEKQIL